MKLDLPPRVCMTQRYKSTNPVAIYIYVRPDSQYIVVVTIGDTNMWSLILLVTWYSDKYPLFELYQSAFDGLECI